jgi:Ca2+-dependent lipid-binding protein
LLIKQGIDLQAQDPNGKSDPFLKVSIGKKVINDKDNYITASLNPIFGKMFELPARLPIDHSLKVCVMDWDRLSAHDLIGETTIDLENRYLSRHRAVRGLPETMSRLSFLGHY